MDRVYVQLERPSGRVHSLAGGAEVLAAAGPVEVPDVLVDIPDILAAEGAREPPVVQRDRVGSYEGGKIAWKKAIGRSLLSQILT